MPKLSDLIARILQKSSSNNFNNSQKNAISTSTEDLSKKMKAVEAVTKELDRLNEKLVVASKRLNELSSAQDIANAKVEKTRAAFKKAATDGTEEQRIAALKELNAAQKELIAAKAITDSEKITARKKVETYSRKIAEAENRAHKASTKVNETVDKIGKKHNLKGDELKDVVEHINNHSEDILASSQKAGKAYGIISNVAKNGFGNVLSSTREFFVEFGIIGELMGLAFLQMEQLNEKMVKFNRSMSLGFSNQMLGMDMNGNSGRGSLTTIAGKNFISEDEFLSAFKGLNKGNTLGNTNNFAKEQEDMQKFGISAAQLGKFYGVEMGTINTITSNLVYNFGAKIKDLNEIFEHGKETATAAGVSVSEYFERLKEATDQIGEHYIAGGMKGMEQLALYAAKTNQSIGEIMKSADRFKNFTSQWQIQNLAAAHAMNETAKNTSRVWALQFTGQYDKSDKLYKGSLASDIINNGMIDKNNSIDNVGLRNLQQMGLQKDEIQAVQRIIKLKKEEGISIEQWLDVDNQSIDVKRKIMLYDKQNVTYGEQLKGMWDKIKGAIIDPIVSVLGPFTKIIFNTVGAIIDFASPLIKFVFEPLYEFGKVIKWLSDELSELIVWLETSYVGKFIKSLDKNTDERAADKSIDTGSATIGGIASVMVAKGLISKTKSFFGSGTAEGATAEGAAAEGGMGLSKLSNLKGLGIGLAIDYGGKFLGNQVGKYAGKETGNKIKTITSDAATGAMLGSFLGPEGTLAGAAIGAVVGTIHASWGQISKVWNDGSKNIFEKLGGVAVAIWDTYKEVNLGILKWWKGLFGHFWGWMTGKEKEEENEKDKKDTNDANAAMAKMVSQGNYLDTQAAVHKILNSRNNGTPNIAEAAQEARMQKEYAPNIHVSVHTMFDKVAKQRIANKGV